MSQRPSPVAFALIMKTFDLSPVAIVAIGVNVAAGASAACFQRPQDPLHLFASFDSTTKTGKQSLTVFEGFMLTHAHATCDYADLILRADDVKLLNFAHLPSHN